MASGKGLPPAHHEDEEEAWLLTYADMLTLLMAFMVMLINFTKYDIPAMQEAVNAIKNEVGGGKDKSPLQIIKNEIQDIIYEMQADEVIHLANDDKGIVIELASSAFYRPGSAEFRPEAIQVLTELTKKIASPGMANYTIEIEGHTDDDPISTPVYPSNWELSAGRATRVVRFLSDQGIKPQRLKAAGFSDSQPKAPNRTADGAPIRENQAANRRVNIRMYPTIVSEQRPQAAKRRSILDLIETGPAVPLDAGAKGGAPATSGAGTAPTANPNVATDVLRGVGVGR